MCIRDRSYDYVVIGEVFEKCHGGGVRDEEFRVVRRRECPAPTIRMDGLNRKDHRLCGLVDVYKRQEVAYTFPKGDNGGGVPIGLLKAKAALVFNTSNTCLLYTSRCV